MSIGLGIFASVVLILAVYHTGFRKVLLSSGAILAALALLCAAAYFGYDRYTTWRADRAEAHANTKDEAAKHEGIVRCMSRLGTPWIAGVVSFGVMPDSGAYFNNLQACTIAPDDYDPYAEYGGHVVRPTLEKSLPSGYALDQEGRVVADIDLSAGLVPKDTHALPCPNNLPLGFTLDQACILSGRIINGFQPEMCIGTIQTNSDCVVDFPRTPATPKTFAGTRYAIQICPFGLPINTEGQSPSWKNVDVRKEGQKLLQYRNNKH